MDKKTLKIISQIEAESKDKPYIQELCKTLKGQLKKDKSNDAKKIIDNLAEMYPTLKESQKIIKEQLIENTDDTCTDESQSDTELVFDPIKLEVDGVINEYWIDFHKFVWDNDLKRIGKIENNKFIEFKEKKERLNDIKKKNKNIRENFKELDN